MHFDHHHDSHDAGYAVLGDHGHSLVGEGYSVVDGAADHNHDLGDGVAVAGHGFMTLEDNDHGLAAAHDTSMILSFLFL